jgi:hypothetical protein
MFKIKKELKIYPAGKFYCKYCNRSYSSASLQRHYDSIKHMNNIVNYNLLNK